MQSDWLSYSDPCTVYNSYIRNVNNKILKESTDLIQDIKKKLGLEIS